MLLSSNWMKPTVGYVEVGSQMWVVNTLGLIGGKSKHFGYYELLSVGRIFSYLKYRLDYQIDLSLMTPNV